MEVQVWYTPTTSFIEYSLVTSITICRGPTWSGPKLRSSVVLGASNNNIVFHYSPLKGGFDPLPSLAQAIKTVILIVEIQPKPPILS